MAPSPSHEKRPPDIVDTLMSLPPQMVDEILSRLPIRDTVRTSALSRSWRHRWKDLPSIDLIWPTQHVVAREVVKAVLRCYAGRIRRFSAHVGKRSARSLGVWFRKLGSRGIESLHLDGTFILSLHVSLFALASLTSLELYLCRVPTLPDGFAGFPKLTKLKLFMVVFPVGGEYYLQDIIAKSPLIEDLYLNDVRTLSETINLWVIQAPNLHRLTILSVDDYGWILGDFPLLDYALIELENYLSGRDFGEFLGKLHHARMLEIYIWHDKPPHAQAILETLPCRFDNLKILKLGTHFLDMPNILSSFCILRNAPNLEELEMKIKVGVDLKQMVEANVDFQNKQWTESMFANLREVQMNDIGCYPNELSFIELVLSKARLLRKLSGRLDVEIVMTKEDALEQLSKCIRASPNVEVSLEDIYGKDFDIGTDMEESTDDDMSDSGLTRIFDE